jgi:hypothetical protein
LRTISLSVPLPTATTRSRSSFAGRASRAAGAAAEPGRAAWTAFTSATSRATFAATSTGAARTRAAAVAHLTQPISLIRRQDLVESCIDFLLQGIKLFALLVAQIELILQKRRKDLSRTGRATCAGRTESFARWATEWSTGTSLRSSPGASRHAAGTTVASWTATASRPPRATLAAPPDRRGLARDRRLKLVLRHNAVLVRVSPLEQSLQPGIGQLVTRELPVAVLVECH